MSTMLRTENLTYSYPAGEENEQPTLALDGVTLAIERGSFTVILGHNGWGIVVGLFFCTFGKFPVKNN